MFILMVLSACAPARDHSHIATDAVGRHIIGPAVNLYLPSHSPLEKSAITSSLSATRALAWERFAAVIATTEITLPTPSTVTEDAPGMALLTAPSRPSSVSIPTFSTWYSQEDINRLMSYNFGQLSTDDMDAGTPITEGQWHESQRLLDNELLTLPIPLQKKWSRFFEDNAQLSSAHIIGATGLNRTLFSPDLVHAVTSRYADLQDCFPDDHKPSPLAPYRSCWSQELPSTSVAIKTTWLNTDAGFYRVATDAESLAQLFSNEDAGWAQAALKGPVPEAIVTAEVGSRRFVLGGIHIMTKELDDWLWISAWWSAEPNRDFGEDRPEFVQKLGAPWNQYKICAVSSYTQDPKELDAMAAKHPGLAAAYRAVLDETGASWCSNPYIEKGARNHKTNCIGCHQFAGTDVSQDHIIGNDVRFPALGRLKQRTDFPSDYIWSATQGQLSWRDTLNTLRFRTEPP